MQEKANQNIQATGLDAAETDRERFERERLTRRQALRKFGLTAGMATFAMFSVDDLARMVGKAMQQRAGDSRVAARIAQEFQQAGIALAGVISPSCQGCAQHYQNCLSCKCNQSSQLGGQTYQQCYNNQAAAYNQCVVHCPGGVYPGQFPPASPCGSVNTNYCA